VCLSRVVVIATSTHNAYACRELGLGFGGLGGAGVFGGSSIVLQSHHLWDGFFVMCSSQQYLSQGLLLHSCVMMLKNISPLTISQSPKKQVCLASPLMIQLQTYNSVHAAATGCNILQHDLFTKSKHTGACLLAIVPLTNHHTIYHTESGLQYCC
jgi:hypothetical protein